MNPEELMKEAENASALAYAPYSEFKVGAALETEGGGIFTGCNIENAAFGLTICAERVAIFKAVSGGETPVKMAVFSDTGYSQPCGSCRQIFIEFNKNTIIYYLKDGNRVEKTASELLPDHFTARSMELD